MLLRHCGHDRSTVTTIFLIYVLHDLLSPLMFKVNINIWWFIPGSRNKSFKEKVKLFWINSGYAQTKTDGRICGGSSSLAENISCPCFPHNVINCEKIGSIVHFPYELQFMVDVVYNLRRQWFAKNFLSSFPGEVSDFFIWRSAFGDNFQWVFIL